MQDLLVPVLLLVGVCLMGVLINSQYKHVEKRLENDTEKYVKITIRDEDVSIKDSTVSYEEAVNLMVFFSVRIAKQIGIDEENMVETIKELYKREEV